MDEPSTIYLQQIQPDAAKFGININLPPKSKQEFPSVEEDVRIAKNTIKLEIDEAQQIENVFIVKEEIREEFVDGCIKKEEVVEDVFESFNSDIPSCIEKCVPVNILYCEQCRYGTNDKETLIDHIFAHRFKCNRCNYTTPNNSMLTTHQQIHVKISTRKAKDMFRCYDCGSSCKSNLKLQIQKPFECNLCDYRGKTSKLLKLHNMLKHRFRCDKCEHATGNKTVNSEDPCKFNSCERNYNCDKCDFKAYSKSKLLNHKIVHSEDRPFRCNLCDFTSKRSNHLKDHMDKHAGVHNFSCDKCDYKTYTKGKLTRHKIVHSGDAPFKCDLCDFSGKRLGDLKIHLNKHSDGHHFSCDECGYKAYSKGRLTEHRRVHSVDKQFKCNLCDFASRRSSYLKVHLSNKHLSERKANKNHLNGVSLVNTRST